MRLPSGFDVVKPKVVQTGFSLVELLVALVFTSVLMAGLSSVFKSSLGAFAAASETLASGRRNRMAMDLLFDDLNMIGMLPSNLFDYPQTDPTNPPFRINPNVNFDPLNATDIPAAEAKADQLDFYYDEVLPFDATLNTTLQDTSQQVGGEGQAGDNSVFSLKFRDADQASSAASAFSSRGLSLFFRSSGYTYKLAGAIQHGSGSTVDATIGADSSYTGSGTAAGATFKTGAVSGTGTVLIQPGRYVRYSIKTKALDPSNATVITPCLMREEVTYGNVSSSTTPFAAPDDSTVVAENVVGFKVSLSGDGGKTWAGGNMTDAVWSDITGGATPASPTLNWQFASGSAPARMNMRSTLSSPFWFREIPMLVRVDVTTRTVNKRTEYAAIPNIATYKNQTQSLIITPRHSGLAYQPVAF